MLKRVVLASILTIAASIVFAFLFLWVGTGSAILGYDWDMFLFGALFLLCAVALSWQRFRWPEVMLSGCAAAFLVGCSIYPITAFAVVHPDAWPWLTSQLFYLDTIRPRLWEPAQVLRGVGLCFPIPLFAVIWSRLTPASNQTIQPTAGRRTTSVSDD